MVPAFSAWVRLPLKETIATSLACVGIFAVPGTITHAVLGDIDWAFAIPLAHRRDPRRADRRALHDRDRRPHAALLGRRRRSGSSRSIYAVGELVALLLSSASSRAREHRVEHRRRELAGERVLLARVERAERSSTAPHVDLEPVREARPAAPGSVDAGGARSADHAAS